MEVTICYIGACILVMEKKLLYVIGALFGIAAVNVSLGYVLVALPADVPELLITASMWLGNVLFAIWILYLCPKARGLSVPIGILSFFTPIFGGIFCLIAIYTQENHGAKS
jgi:hypothetical protein